MFHAFSGGRRSPSPIILPLPLTIRSYISPSDIPESTPGVAQSFIVRLIEAATSPLPSPASPWHMAQSYPKIFFAVAIPSGVALTGFFRSTPVGGFAASAVAATAAGGAGAGAAPLSLALSCCAVETLNPVSSTTPAQTNPWRIKTSSLRITPGMFGPDERNRRHTPADYLRAFYTRELRGQQEIFRFLARGHAKPGPGRVLSPLPRRAGPSPYPASSAPYRLPLQAEPPVCARLPSPPAPVSRAGSPPWPGPRTAIHRAPAGSSAPSSFPRAAAREFGS